MVMFHLEIEKGCRLVSRKLYPSSRKTDQAIRKEIFERDKFTCQMCGAKPKRKPKNYTGRYTIYGVKVLRKNTKTDGGVSYLVIDHIIPWKKGGTIESDNLQTLCDPCNSSKGDRIDGI